MTLPTGSQRAVESQTLGEPANGSSQPVRTHRILVVDDNHDAAESLAMVLRSLGHEVHLEHDGPSALVAARALRPQALLLDIGLPRLDGYEVCRRLRSETWGRGLVIIAVSGWGAEEHVARAKAAGFDAHVVKPADPRRVIALLAEHVPAVDGAAPG